VTTGGSPGSLAPAQTWPWIGTDARGCIVILTQSRWVAEAKHHDEFGDPSRNLPPDPLRVICRALTDPDRILDNAQRRGAPPRVGNERYYRQDPYCDPAHVIIVVKVLPTGQVIDGYPAPAGARVAWTFFVAPQAPMGAQLWP
jgi:hypothetical protein